MLSKSADMPGIPRREPLRTVTQFLHRVICRHKESVTQYEPGRMYLRCLDCGFETPGFEIEITDKGFPTLD